MIINNKHDTVHFNLGLFKIPVGKRAILFPPHFIIVFTRNKEKTSIRLFVFYYENKETFKITSKVNAYITVAMLRNTVFILVPHNICHEI